VSILVKQLTTISEFNLASFIL